MMSIKRVAASSTSKPGEWRISMTKTAKDGVGVMFWITDPAQLGDIEHQLSILSDTFGDYSFDQRSNKPAYETAVLNPPTMRTDGGKDAA